MAKKELDKNAARWGDDGQPTLGNLLSRIDQTPGKSHLYEMYRQVASGERNFTSLPNNVGILACQMATILFAEFLDRENSDGT